MNEPMVSVVMVVCNVERFLAQAIESILDQSWEDFEFIVVDFGSTDSSPVIQAHYAAKDSRIRCRSIPPCGLAEARNAACALARGRYIAVMDADDIAAKERLRWEVDFLEAHPRVGAVGGAVEWINARGESLLTVDNPLHNDEIQVALLERSALWHPTALIRTDAFRFVGGYRKAFTSAHDYDLWLRIAEHFELANLGRTLLRYRIHSEQVSARKRRQQSLFFLAAQASAARRRAGREDPLSAAPEITLAMLETLGVSEAAQQATVARESLRWIRLMYQAGEDAAALSVADEVLEMCRQRHTERWVLADLRLLTSRIHWRQKRFGLSIRTGFRALIMRPVLIGRPVKSLLGRLRAGGAARGSVRCG
jgi:GT2 family glycosyltransferase